MNQEVLMKNVRLSISKEWLLQLVASLSWAISVIVYGSYELGDCLQLLAASAWTTSNILGLFNNKNN